MYRSIARRALALIFFVAVAATAATPAEESKASALDRVVTVRIEAQALSSALIEFSKQAGVQVITPAEKVSKLKSRAVSGQMPVSDALARLLSGTNLGFHAAGANTIGLEVRAASGAGNASPAGTEELPLRLAQATGGEERKDAQTAQETRQATEDSRGIPEMLVKGARTSNIDIQRTIDDVQPYVVFTAEDIERSMSGSLDQFLMSKLPMNASRYTAGVIQNTNLTMPTNGNLSAIDLRGLGSAQTLILVNGRRVPGVSNSSTLSQPDINGIPMSSVKRIEILPSTAGGIYGGGATGGVINIILKDDYQGVEINARYDGTFRQDAASRVLEASGGFNLENGRTTVMFSGSHQDSIPLMHGERNFAQRGRDLLIQNTPTLYTGTVIPAGNTSNIRSSNGSPLVLAAGNRPLGSAITFVPYGYAGPTSDNGAGLLANAGKYNLDFPTGPQGLDRAITGAPTVGSLRLNVRRSFTDRIDAFVEATQSTNDSDYAYSSAPSYLTNVPVGTPNNPFTTPINIRFPANDFNEGDIVTTSEVRNINGGVSFRLPRNWTVQGEYGVGHSEHGYSLSQESLYGLYDNLLLAGTLSALRDLSAYPQNYSTYSQAQGGPTGYQPGPMTGTLTNKVVRLAGPTVRLPGGPVMLSALLERRQDEMEGTIFASLPVGFAQQTPIPTWTYNYLPPRKVTTDGAYMELTAPLISAANTLPLVRALDLQVSYRRDRIGSRTIRDNAQGNFSLPSLDAPLPEPDYFTRSVDANQYTVGLRYQPLESLALRVSNGVGVLPPSVMQLTPTTVLNSPVLGAPPLDPKRGNTVPGVIEELRLTGNPDLVPEESDSWSAGAIFTPSFLSGLRLSVDYTRIEKTNEISTISAQTVLNLESTYPDRVRRLALSAADQALGYTGGRITYLNTGRANIAHTNVEAYDFRADYRWSTRYGSFTAEALATHQVHFQRQLLPTSAVTEFMGFADGPLEWRGNAGLTWERNAWTLGWNTQYFDSFPVYDTSTNAATRASNIRSQGAEFVARQIYHDLSFKYRIEEAPKWGGMFANSSVLVGVSNVFDTSPPLMLWTGLSMNTPATTVRYGDPRMRRYSISLRKNF